MVWRFCWGSTCGNWFDLDGLTVTKKKLDSHLASFLPFVRISDFIWLRSESVRPFYLSRARTFFLFARTFAQPNIDVDALEDVINRHWQLCKVMDQGQSFFSTKKARKSDRNNDRQITIQCTLRHILCRIIKTRMRIIVDLSEYESGWFPSIDNAFMLSERIHKLVKQAQNPSATLDF
jgi:hypothetical protein